MTARRSAKALAALALLLAAGYPARATTLPSWAAAARQSAPSLDEQDTDEEFRVLFRERVIEVQADGTLSVRDRIAKQALSPHADEIGLGGFYLGPGAKISRSKAWHSAPGKTTKKAKSSAVFDISDAQSFLTDRTVRSIMVNGIRRGSTVFFEFEGEWKPEILGTQYTFANAPLVDRSRLTVRLPPGWKLVSDWRDGPSVEPVVEDGSYTFEFTGLDTPRESRLALSVADRAPQIFLQFVPADPVAVPYVATWQDLGQWFEDLTSDLPDDPAVDQAAAEAATGDPLTTIASCCQLVRDRVRYVAETIGIGGYKPRPAGETLGQLWGDCKDKATLLGSMLKTNGIKGYPVLVSLSHRGTVSEKVPLLTAFDHMILAISLPEDLELPPKYETALLDDPLLGRLLIVDTTDERTSIGWISGGLSAKKALIVDGKRSHLVTLPGGSPRDHRIERQLAIALDEARSATVSLELRVFGAPSRSYRESYANSKKDLMDDLASTVRDFWPGAEVGEIELTPEDESGAFLARIPWTLADLPRSGEGALLHPFPRAGSILASVSTRRRKSPVVYEYPLQIRTTARIVGLPDSARLPDDSLKQGDGWRTERIVRRDGSTATAEWTMELTKTRFEPEEMRSLKSLYRALRAGESTLIVVP